MASISISINRSTLGLLALAAGASYLYTNKPDQATFKPFFLKWMQDKMAASQRNNDDLFGSMNNVLNQVGLRAQFAMAVISFEDYYLFTECVCTLPGFPPLQFIGFAGQWFFVQQLATR
eukprot:g2052.t1